MVWILKVPLSAPEGESFVSRPSTLDAYVFGFLAPLYKVSFPKVHLQKHLKQLCNLCRFCDDILDSYFRPGPGGVSPAGQEMVDANLQKLTQLVNKESNLIEKMDGNLRQSPQLLPRKLPTLKLTPAEEESNSLQLLSPWQSQPVAAGLMIVAVIADAKCTETQRML